MLQMRSRLPGGAGQVLLGAGLALLLHLGLQMVMRFLLQPALAYIGLTQWLYLGPAAYVAGRRGRAGVRRGILAVGVLTFLINAIAYGVMYYLFFVPHG